MHRLNITLVSSECSDVQTSRPVQTKSSLGFSFFINPGPGPVKAGQDWPHKGGSEVSKRVVQPLLASWPLVSLAGQW